MHCIVFSKSFFLFKLFLYSFIVCTHLFPLLEKIFHSAYERGIIVVACVVLTVLVLFGGLESYSISSQHEEVVVQSSSSSQYSATSVSSSAVSATAVSSSSYQSSSVSGAITEGGVTSTASTALAITETGRPVFKRTISGLSLERK